MSYIIKDWANNTCFKGRDFESFEDAWGFIYDFYRDLPEDDFNAQMGEYFVEVAV